MQEPGSPFALFVIYRAVLVISLSGIIKSKQYYIICIITYIMILFNMIQYVNYDYDIDLFDIEPHAVI
jgi:hypothetical protein